MTDKELRKLRRTELLEMMIEGRQAVAAAEEKVEELASALDKKKLLTEEAESVAEVTARLAAAVESAERAQALFEKALGNAAKKSRGAGDQA